MFLTEQTATLAIRRRRVETWTGRCDGCAAVVTYTIPVGSMQPTLRDATSLGQLAQAIKDAVRRRARARRERRNASNV